MLTFDAPSHTYRWQGVIVPSVTQVLDVAARFDYVTPEELEAAQRRGNYTHELCEADDLDDLDEDAERDGPHWPRLLAWRKFCADFGPNWSGIEERHYSKVHRLAGTLDRRGTLTKHKDGARDLWVIDIKTSAAHSKIWGLQIAAYRALLAEREPMYALARRASVRLLEDGSYKFDEFTDANDWAVYRALLTCHHYFKD